MSSWKGGETTRKLFICFVTAVVMIISMFPVGNAYAALTDWFGSNDLYRSNTYIGTHAAWYDNDETTGEVLSGLGGFVWVTDLELREARILADGPIRMSFRDENNNEIFTASSKGTPGQLEIVNLGDREARGVRITSSNVMLYEIEFYVAGPPDLTPPAVPTGLRGSFVGDDAVLTWNANTDPDLNLYYLYQDGVKVLETKDVTATIKGLPYGIYKFQLSAIDFAGNESAKTPELTLEKKPPPPPPPPPAAPTGLRGQGNDKQALLNWTANTEPHLAGYIVYQDGREIHRTTSNSVAVNNLVNGQSYTFSVAAFDTFGNVSGRSNSVTVVPSDKIDVNLIPNMDSIIVQVISGTQPFDIDWGSGNDTFSASQYVISGLQANTDYTVTLTDDQGRVWSGTINTGNVKGFVPPSFPNPQDLFQKMLDMFGTAGTIAVAIIGGAILLGILCVLAMWAWRLLKNWLHRTK